MAGHHGHGVSTAFQGLINQAACLHGALRKTGVTKWGWRTCYSHPLLPLAQVRPHLRSLSFLLVGGRVSFRLRASCVCQNGWIRWLCSIAMSFKNFRCRFKSRLRKNRLQCVMATVAARCVVAKFCQGVLCNIFLDSTFYSEVLACGSTAWDLLEGIGSQFPYSKWMSGKAWKQRSEGVAGGHGKPWPIWLFSLVDGLLFFNLQYFIFYIIRIHFNMFFTVHTPCNLVCHIVCQN